VKEDGQWMMIYNKELYKDVDLVTFIKLKTTMGRPRTETDP
jgi:hypothetical protein